jgi:hypothetical protein
MAQKIRKNQVDLYKMCRAIASDALHKCYSSDRQVKVVVLEDNIELTPDAIAKHMEERWIELGQPTRIDINSGGIQIVTPTAAKALVLGIVQFEGCNQVPSRLTNCSYHLLQGLGLVANIEQIPLWAQANQDDLEVIGHLDARLRDLLPCLKTPQTARELSFSIGIPKARLSVYLRELFCLGLVLQTKIPGGDRGTRSWAFQYALPW